MTDDETHGSSCYRWSVFGKPIPKGRPRMTRAGRSYTPPKTKRAERHIRTVSALHAPSRPLEGRLSVELEFVFEAAKSWTKKKRAAANSGALPHTIRPDLDNLIKLALDSLNGLVWQDDTQVAEIKASKHYGPQALTRFRVSTQGET